MPDINVNKLSEAINTKADIDLNNTGVFFTSEGGGVSLTSSTPADASGKEVTSADFIKSDIQSNLLNYTTNRILEIPQDIKLELNNGTLTLKAGSKVYVPNGSGGFEAVITTYDKSQKPNYNANCLCFPVTSDGLANHDRNLCFSGTTQPTSGQVWLNTNTMQFYVSSDNGVTWNLRNDYCLPIAKTIATSGTGITSIDQVFNGFGYIGGTLFALPGVKIQTPNGKNEDGTYKSVIRSVDSVRTYNAGAWGTRNLNIQFSGSLYDLIFEGQAVERFTYNKKFSSDTTTYSYDENTGWWWYSPDQSSWAKNALNIVGSCRVESGKITKFQVDTVDSVANSNASNFSQAGRSYLSGLGMPSGRYIDLTLGASESSYRAPANGYFTILGAFDTTPSQTNGVFISMSCGGITNRNSGTLPKSYGVYIPAKKGQSMFLEYVNFKMTGYNFAYFRFVYAEGDNNV